MGFLSDVSHLVRVSLDGQAVMPVATPDGRNSNIDQTIHRWLDTKVHVPVFVPVLEPRGGSGNTA
jgi:hypothetical protein